jgi:hypothetical protein
MSKIPAALRQLVIQRAGDVSDVESENKSQSENTIYGSEQKSSITTTSQTVDYCIFPDTDIHEKSNNCSAEHTTNISKFENIQKQNINININVDMTTWDIEKIDAFFKAANGKMGNQFHSCY